MGKQNERLYKLDENGIQWFFYKDRRTKYIVRAVTASKEDIKKLLKISDTLDIEYLKKGVTGIDRENNQDKDMWIIEDSNGDPISAADVFYRPKGRVDIAYYFKNPVFRKLYEKEVKRTLYDLGKEELKSSIYSIVNPNNVKAIYTLE